MDSTVELSARRCRCLTDCGNSPTSGGEWHVVAVVEANFAGEGAIFSEVGVPIA